MLSFMLNCFSCKESNILSNEIPIKPKEISPSTEESKIKEGTSLNMQEKPLEFHCIQNVRNDFTISENDLGVNVMSNTIEVIGRSRESSKRSNLKAKRKFLLEECF